MNDFAHALEIEMFVDRMGEMVARPSSLLSTTSVNGDDLSYTLYELHPIRATPYTSYTLSVTDQHNVTCSLWKETPLIH